MLDPHMYLTHIRGMKIKDYIKENGLTQQQFAYLVGVSQSTISRLLDSKESTPIGLIQRICEATKGDVKPEDFFPFRVDPETPSAKAAAVGAEAKAGVAR